MDDTQSVLATGGMGGLTTIALYFVYKLLRQGVRSRCCGREVEVGLVTPKNIEVRVDETHDTAKGSKGDAHESRPSGSSGRQDTGGVQSETSQDSQRDGRPSHQFERANPLHITVP